MSLTRIKYFSRILLLIAVFTIPAVCHGEEFKVFSSEEYGFSMKYPASWVKVEPKGNYYVVFQAPDLVDNFRNRIHVAAHKPVKDPIEVFLKELRNGIADLQKQGSGRDGQQVKILDEGEFKCEVPGAYYFFIQAYDNKIKIWMDIVIVFYKQDQTLLRVSCLAPSQSMEKFQPIFNEVLVSIKFASQEASGPAPAPKRPLEMTPPPAPPTMQTIPPPPPRQPAQPSVVPESLPEQPRRPAPETRFEQPSAPAPAPAPRPGPRGPLREPEGPSTGIVN